MEGAPIELLRLDSFPAPHAFTTKSGGVSEGPYAELNLGRSVDDDPDAVNENRRLVLEAFGADPERTATIHQVHGAEVVEAHEAGPEVRADGIVTDDPAWTLAISVADCAPVLLVDPAHGAVAALHAGWRGVVAGIVDAGVEALAGRFGSRPDRMRVAIGPHISGPRYQVGPEVVEAFMDAGFPDGVARPDPDASGRFLLSVDAAVRVALARCGVRPGHVADGGWCTASDARRFFSHRRDRGSTGRHWALLRPPR
ncbi:MAG: peptidoglycan editing factor PgeF [Trueperaceae bacterium]|nr:peptidoglycan editing factor PgeF [Trueperaceae bacterium]